MFEVCFEVVFVPYNLLSLVDLDKSLNKKQKPIRRGAIHLL